MDWHRSLLSDTTQNGPGSPGEQWAYQTGHVTADGEAGRGSRRGGIEDMHHGPGLLDDEIVEQRAIGPHRLGADTGPAGEEVVRGEGGDEAPRQGGIPPGRPRTPQLPPPPTPVAPCQSAEPAAGGGP